MSLSTVAAARIFEGQARGEPGEEHRLSFEDFPQTALSRTYNTDMQTPDSAGTITAMMTGAKTRIGMVNVGQAAARGDCAGARTEGLVSALELAEIAGLSTGIVTTARLTHATPAGTYAHAADREWENDAKLPAQARDEGCRDIATQFVEFATGDGIDVTLAGGRANFMPEGAADPEYPETNGKRKDGRNLIDDWRQRHADGSYVWNARQLAELDLARTPRLLGLFEPDHLKYEHDRVRDRAGEPSLAELTRTAIAVLARNPKGYFLMVEGGRIDHAHHAGNAYRALSETAAFSDAVRAAVEASSEADTLIVVTADHSHTMSFMGYARRGNPILGKVVGSSSEDSAGDFATDALGQPYTTLSYASGPGYPGASDSQPDGPKHFPHLLRNPRPSLGRPDLGAVDTQAPDYLQHAPIPLRSETHGGDDVGVWARGPGSEAVRGSIEQNVIFHLMLQAQPALVRLLCEAGDCESGVPVVLPTPAALRAARPTQAR
jgi:alkaline phosphatase